MTTVKMSADRLKELICRFSNMGGVFRHDGFCYYFDEQGRVCCTQTASVESDTVEILDGTEIIKAVSRDQPYTVKTKRLILPPSLKTIGAYTFNDSRIRSIDFGGTEMIGDAAFRNTRLGEIVLPDTVQQLGRMSFMNTRIKSIAFSTQLKQLDPYAFMESNLQYADMSRCMHLELLDFNAFSHCKKLETVLLPPSVSILGTSTFLGSAITAVNIRYTQIKTIPIACFVGCWKLTAVKLPEVCEFVASDVFQRCTQLRQIYVSRHTPLHETRLSDQVQIIYY